MRSVNSLTALGLSLFASFALAACSGSKEASEMSKFADRMCACKAADCADKLYDELEKFAKANEGKEVEASAADKYNAEMDRAQKCYVAAHPADK
jgi:hypothetical protein